MCLRECWCTNFCVIISVATCYMGYIKLQSWGLYIFDFGGKSFGVNHQLFIKLIAMYKIKPNELRFRCCYLVPGTSVSVVGVAGVSRSCQYTQWLQSCTQLSIMTSCCHRIASNSWSKINLSGKINNSTFVCIITMALNNRNHLSEKCLWRVLLAQPMSPICKRGGDDIYELFCSQPPGNNWDVLASPSVMSNNLPKWQWCQSVLGIILWNHCIPFSFSRKCYSYIFF